MSESNLRVNEAELDSWVERFHRDGYLFLEDVLPQNLVDELKADLDWALENRTADLHGENLCPRMFESSKANLSLFDLEPIVSFAEKLVEPNCHVFCNNSFITKPGQAIIEWHQDDAPHFLSLDGEPATNIRPAVLFFTANYYLTDVTEPEHGGTEVIPGSHLFGQPCPQVIEGTKWEDQAVPCLGKAGSVVLFNNQVWHRGGPNLSDRTRYITQISYGRRMIGHKYYPFMNYVMPEHIYRDASPRFKRLLGFLPKGAYG